mmetsp:Transcript_32537/g.76882  ORF Transcript_32537/g.76882 Transcript_32537/m.76882 type:complete len:253 (+) Transcript_32537:771-1529(+)
MERRRHDGGPRRAGQHPLRAVRRRVHPHGGGGRRGRQPHRLPRHAQGVRGRRRQGHPHGAGRGRAAHRLPAGAGRGARLAGLPRAALPGRAPPGGAGHGRQARQRHRARRARLLDAAPLPEDLRGGPTHRGRRRGLRRDAARRGQPLPQPWLRLGGHGRVHVHPRHQGVLLPRAQPAPAGGAPGLREHHGREHAGHAAARGHGHPALERAGGARVLRGGQVVHRRDRPRLLQAQQRLPAPLHRGAHHGREPR